MRMFCLSSLILALAFGPLIGCASAPGDELDAALTVIELTAEDERGQAPRAPTLERPWAGRPIPAHLSALDDDDPEQMTELHIQLRRKPARDQAPRPDPDRYVISMPPWHAAGDGDGNTAHGTPPTPSDNPVVLSIDRPGMSVTFAGSPRSGAPGDDVMHGGIARITLHEPFVNAARQLIAEPSNRQLILLALRDLTAQQVRGYAQLEQPPGFEQVLALADAGVDAVWIAELNHAGYRFDVQELIALKTAGVPTAEAVAMRQGGLRYDADQLIALHEAGVSSGYALGLHEAGFADTSDDVIRIHSAQITADYAAAMRQRRVATDTDTLIAVHAAGVTPASVDTFEEAGYVLGASELLTLTEAGVQADDALALRRAGYGFSLDDLLKLRRWQVPTDYALSLVAEGFAPLTADQVVDLRLRKVSPELVEALRQREIGTDGGDAGNEDAEDATGTDNDNGITP